MFLTKVYLIYVFIYISNKVVKKYNFKQKQRFY